jgi:multidrug resistance efflux pump
MKEAMDAFDQIQKKAKGIKDPTLNMKRFSQGLKSAERELDKLNKKASKPRSNDEREKARAAKAQARVEAQAAKEAARTAARRERAELRLLDTASSFKVCNTLPMLSLHRPRLQRHGSLKHMQQVLSPTTPKQRDQTPSAELQTY